MKNKKILTIVIAGLAIFCSTASGEQMAVEQEVMKEEPRFTTEGKEKVYVHSYLEYGWVKQGSRKGNWQTWQTRLAYLEDNIPAIYADITKHRRMGVDDYTIDIGSYKKVNKGYIHGGVGYGGPGGDQDFIYRFKAFLEVEQQIVGNLNLNLDAKYMHYPKTEDTTGDVFLLSPGLVYYFGNHYISADYGISLNTERGSASFGIVKSYFVINKYIGIYSGIAFGQRLYDIFPVAAAKQSGYILYSGIDVGGYKHIKLRIGGSYSQEGKRFIKRSIDCGGVIRF
jgi:YaiO family outer membrane protein